ncbi:MAG: hypothetical protein C0393_01810 [Anaerolinea sp.]|nr:hypothetical protein [Anaerolinea sp.]
MQKRLASYVLFVIGLFLLGGVLLYGWHTARPARLAAESVPGTIAGLPLSQVTTGQEAIASIHDLHGRQFSLVDGAVAVYGNRNITLWVSISGDEGHAAELLELMGTKIAEGRSPFSDNGIRQIKGRAVYDLTGLGQRHFYFQSGRLVIWLAADETIAAQALEETLNFYP